MTDTIDRTVEQHDADGNVTSTRTFRYDFTGSALYIGEVTLDQDGIEQVVPAGYQPWRCMPDGTRQSWTNAEDAFAWADQEMRISK